MISPAELRLGNLITLNGKVVAVTDISQGKIWFEESESLGVSFSPEAYDPIPLTVDVLVKAGFKMLYPSAFMGDLVVRYDDENLINVYVGHTMIVADIEHLHQLQNLYFALTDEELNIDIKEL